METFKELQKYIPMEDIKECPFCGNDYITLNLNPKERNFKFIFFPTMECRDCGITLPLPQGVIFQKSNAEKKIEEIIKVLKEIWNKRN